MQKLQSVFLFMFLIACSPSQSVLSTASPPIEATSSPTPAPPALTSTPVPTMIPSSTSAPIGGGAGKIAFTSEQDGEHNIYVINADGSNLVELASDISSKFNPAWSLDGTKVSFGSATERSASLYIMNADGTHLSKVLDTSELDAYDQIRADSYFGNGCCTSIWSPDNEKIIFKTTRVLGCCEYIGHIHILNLNNNQLFGFRVAGWSSIFWSPDSTLFGFSGTDPDICGSSWSCVMNVQDAKPVNLSNIEGATFLSDLYWSPDGKKISFAAFLNSKNMDVYVMNADFSNPINISRYLTKGQNGGPVWSPDSKKIAFSSCDVYLCELYVMNADDSNSIKLTSQVLGLSSAGWSPDSQKIAYVSADSGNDEIYIVNSDGRNNVNLTNHPAKDSNPVWSPDGTKIAFVSDREGNDEIYILDVRDMSLFRLTKMDANDFSPVWLP
jgi:Tol biopolymer transport system component